MRSEQILVDRILDAVLDEHFRIVLQHALAHLRVLDRHELREHSQRNTVFAQVGDHLFLSGVHFRNRHVVTAAVGEGELALEPELVFISMIVLLPVLRLSEHGLFQHVDEVGLFILFARVLNSFDFLIYPSRSHKA